MDVNEVHERWWSGRGAKRSEVKEEVKEEVEEEVEVQAPFQNELGLHVLVRLREPVLITTVY